MSKTRILVWTLILVAVGAAGAYWHSQTNRKPEEPLAPSAPRRTPHRGR